MCVLGSDMCYYAAGSAAKGKKEGNGKSDKTHKIFKAPLVFMLISMFFPNLFVINL